MRVEGPAARSSRRSVVLAAVALAILATSVYLPGLPGDFVYDDRRLIVDNDGLKRPFDPARAFLRDYYASDTDRVALGYYRPVAILSNELDYRRGGGRSLPFHVTNIAVHVGSTLLVFVLGLQLFASGALPAAVGAALFAVHAAHAESVAFISGRVDPLATLFTSAALIAHLRSADRRFGRIASAAAGAAWFVALLSKEMAVTAPVLAFLLETAREGLPRRGERWARAGRYVPYVVAMSVYLGIRFLALGPPILPSGQAAPSILKASKVIGSYLAWLVVPPPGLHLEPTGFSWLGTWVAPVLAIGVLLIAVWLWGRGLRLEAALVGFVIVALGPVAQLRPLETVLSERFLYLPSVGVSLLASGLAARARRIGRVGGRATLGILAALIVYHTGILVPRVATWRDEVSLWRAKEVEDGGSLKARLNLAYALARAGERDEALVWLNRARDIAPDLEPGLAGEAAAMFGELGSRETESALLAAIDILPEDGALWSNLGFHYLRKPDADRAVDAFTRATGLTPNRATSWMGLALARLALQEPAQAGEAAARAIELDPDLALARAVFAETELRQGRPCRALAVSEGVVLVDAGERATLERIRALAREACPGARGAEPAVP